MLWLHTKLESKFATGHVEKSSAKKSYDT